MDLKEYVLTDRAFLHDISNQLVVAQACASYLKKSLNVESNHLSEKDEQKLMKLNNSIEKMLESLKSRKQFVSEHK